MPRIVVILKAALLCGFLIAMNTFLAPKLSAQDCDPTQLDPPCNPDPPGESIPPTVTIIPGSGATFGAAAKVITIEWCDNLSLNAQPWIRLNGVDISAGFTYLAGSRAGCGAFATSTDTVTLTLGPNTLEASISDNAGKPGQRLGKLHA